MNIQILGTKKDNNTRKAERFFKERGIRFQFREFSEKGISKGELENITRVIKPEDLIDKEGKEYKKRNMSFMKFDIEEELLSDPFLIKMPVVRNGNFCTAGYEPETWNEWVEENIQ
jgi:arsenate reductase-like glutaredoxin family protein